MATFEEKDLERSDFPGSDDSDSMDDEEPEEASGTVPRSSTATVVDHILGDEPASDAKLDRLGFGPYVRAVARFLTDPSTKIPLTMSVEGIWGAGKSSFMLLLQGELRKLGQRRIVAFNAWQYPGDEGLWAAFLTQFDSELLKGMTRRQRFAAKLRLLRLRLEWQDWLQTVKAVLWMASAVFVLVWMGRYLAHGGVKVLSAYAEGGKWGEAVGKTLAVAGGAGGTLAAVLIFLSQFKELFKSPVSAGRMSKVWSRTDHDDKMPMIHRAVKEFSELVQAYVQDGNVYIFVDDLDRCEHARAAEVMQMLLTLLSNAPRVALVLGVDRDKVAAAMAARQEKLLPYLYKMQPSETFAVGIEYGHRFLEKFIQITYTVPTPDRRGLIAMINPDAPPPKEPVVNAAQAATTIKVVTGKDDSGTLNDLIGLAADIFNHNPRNVKQFVNIFRLQAFIANETGLFESDRVMKGLYRSKLSIVQLAKVVLLVMRWPELADDARADPDLLRLLETRSPQLSKSDAKWLEDRQLLTLLSYVSKNSMGSLQWIDLRQLMTVATIRPVQATDAASRAMPIQAEEEDFSNESVSAGAIRPERRPKPAPPKSAPPKTAARPANAKRVMK